MSNISRDEAVRLLDALADNPLLDRDFVLSLQEISRLIKYEKCGIHGWGAGDDFDELWTPPPGGIITEPMRRRKLEVWNKYCFEKSAFERGGADDGG